MYYLVTAPRVVLATVKFTAQHGFRAQDSEEPCAHSRRRHRLYARGRLHQITAARVGLQRTEDLVHLLPVHIVLVRQVRARPQLSPLCHIHQPCRVLIGQRLDQSSIDKRKDRHTRANPKRHHKDRGQGESRTPSHLTKSEMRVLPHCLKPKPHYLVTLLLQPGRIAELAHRRIMSRLRRNSRLAKLLLLLLTVKRHLLL